jgi:hypothetical protein
MRKRWGSVGLSAVLAVVGTVFATTTADPPDSRSNGITGAIETADTPWSGTNYNVRHVINPGNGNSLLITMLTSDTLNNLGARVLINPVNGDSWVAWWRDDAVDQIVVRRHLNATGTWTAARVQSTSLEGSRRPSVAFDGVRPWMAYEADAAGGGTRLEAKVIEDDPAPFVTAKIVGTTSNTGTTDVLIQAESGRLWVSWVDSSTQVGWSRYDYGTATWGTPAYESYASDSVAAARGRIRSTVLAS